MCSSIGRAIARFARGPGFESRHSRSMFFCYIGDPDVISKLCYDHIPPAHKLITICYNRTTSVSIVSVSFALCAASGGLVQRLSLTHNMCSEHALSLIENYIAKRQRSCVAQSVEQSPGLREVLGSNPGTADQCFSAILVTPT